MAQKSEAAAQASVIIGAGAAFIEELSRALDDYTIGSQQQLLLLALYVNGELNQQDLPRYTGVERSSNSRNIARLGGGQFLKKPEEDSKQHVPGQGLVESYEEPTDRRQKMVRLTPKGRAVLEGVARRVSPLIFGK